MSFIGSHLATRRPAVDFSIVAPQHEKIDKRLRNWGRWCNPIPLSRRTAICAMFRDYRSTDIWVAADAREPVDSLDAIEIAKAVKALPDQHRAATQWHYVKPVSPIRAARQIGVTLETLANLVKDARSMLVNRRA